MADANKENSECQLTLKIAFVYEPYEIRQIEMSPSSNPIFTEKLVGSLKNAMPMVAVPR